jgi:hypothetical protein
MPNILTSWKEIGQYLGKGVRTVQRWEREAGLPVRRQAKPAPNAVIAIPDELDAWARSLTRGHGGAVADALQKEVATLRAENGELRARLDLLEAAVTAMSVANAGSANHRLLPGALLALDNGISVRPGRGITASTELLHSFGDVCKEGSAIRFAAQQCRLGAVYARLSFASILCALSETRAHDGGLAVARRAQRSALQVRSSLESPGYLPQHELEVLRTLLTKLELRIALVAQTLTCPPDPVGGRLLPIAGPVRQA